MKDSVNVPYTDTERIALVLLAKNEDIKSARDGVVPGSYDVDFTVRVPGTVEVEQDTMTSPSFAFDVQTMFLLLVKRLGHTRESGMALFDALHAESCAMPASLAKKLASESGIEEAALIHKARIVAKLGKSKRRGATRGKLKVEPVSAVPAVANSQGEAEERNLPVGSDIDSAIEAILA